MATDQRPEAIRQQAEQLYEAVSALLEHDGDTAGYSFLPEEEAVPVIEAALLAVRQQQRERDIAKVRKAEKLLGSAFAYRALIRALAEAIEADAQTEG